MIIYIIVFLCLFAEIKEYECNNAMRGRLPTPMGHSMARAQTEQAREFLSQSVQTLSDYLNETTLASLEQEESGRKDYYREILSNLRKLAVYCEEGLEACRIRLQQEPFQDAAAERTLYQIYHRCIEEFLLQKRYVVRRQQSSLYGKKCHSFSRTSTSLIKEFDGFS